jgi:hypothetical protein
MNGDTEETAHITGSPVLTTTATNHSPHANYAIKGGVGSLRAANYTFVAGFGTLAVVGGSNAADPRSGEQAALSSTGDDGSVVRSALVNREQTMIVPQPEFVAGLRGESGVFVRDAMLPQPATASPMLQASTARSALPSVAADSRISPEASVRSVTLPTAAKANGLQSLSTRSAMKTVVVSAPKGIDVPVRAIVLPTQTVGSTIGQPSEAGSAIQRAFHSSGTK